MLLPNVGFAFDFCTETTENTICKEDFGFTEHCAIIYCSNLMFGVSPRFIPESRQSSFFPLALIRSSSLWLLLLIMYHKLIRPNIL